MLNNMLGEAIRSPRLSVISKEPSDLGILPRGLFIRMLCLERKRTERSARRFVLMLLDLGGLLRAGEPVMAKLMGALTQSSRDTDLRGWYEEGVIGVIFTELGSGEEKSVVRSLSAKVTDALYEVLTIEQTNEIRLSFHVFPEDWADDGTDRPATSTMQVALALEKNWKKAALGVKRLMDIAGSLAALFLSLPLMLIIAMAIKLTSKGPVFFRQVRLGQYGKKFTFLKFRSMHVNNDHSIHEEYVKQFIAGRPSDQAAGNQEKIYKLTADPRITPLGRFLRKTSLDEFPQFWNVLKGDMSLVGPRPPVMYEFESYGLWHRQRLTAVKPGITGLWQVDGRSRVTFDEMVRLDIRYARSWSLWLDLKILIQTPRAVVSGSGAC
jgi:lipopolysaccharide/colanic/teichoic acid biosynthesis glycosyltransferase